MCWLVILYQFFCPNDAADCTEGVSQKNEWSESWSFASAIPRGGERWAAATCHWERCTLLVQWKGRGGSPQANQAIPTAGWLPSSALLSSSPVTSSLSLHLSPSLISVQLSLRHTIVLQQWCCCRDSLCSLAPSPTPIFTVPPWFILG